MAIITALWTESSGVMTRSVLDARPRLFVRQAATQTPQPRHIASSRRARFFFGWRGSLADTRVIASTGHAAAQSPQPVQDPPDTTGRKFVVWMGLRRPKRRWAIMASQQQPQQLQMKLTRFRMFSPNWTRLRPRASSRSDS